MSEEKKRNWFARHKILTGILIVIVLASIGGSLGGSDTPTTNNTATGTQQEAPVPEPAPAKWDVEENYAKINNGMTKAQVEAAIGKMSDNCSESATEYVGKTEFCTYGGMTDNGMITVYYSNDTVSSKSKNVF